VDLYKWIILRTDFQLTQKPKLAKKTIGRQMLVNLISIQPNKLTYNRTTQVTALTTILFNTWKPYL